MDHECELSVQHPAIPGIWESQSEDVIHSSCLEADIEGIDHVVDTHTIIPQEGDGENGPANPIGEEEGSKHEGKGVDAKPVLQSERQVRTRKPPDHYEEWILNSLQQIVDRIQLLEDKRIMEKDRIKQLKPKLLKKARDRTLTILIFVSDLNSIL